jgi:hypothetical protein
MWKFLSGVSKPESKWKVDTRESNKAYDATKRKTIFQSHWHNISHIFKTYSECRILHVIIKNFQATLTAQTNYIIPPQDCYIVQ